MTSRGFALKVADSRLPMKSPFLFLPVVFLAGWASAAEEPVKISIPALLNPETQLKTFQEFRVKTSSRGSRELRYSDWTDLRTFMSWHGQIRVVPLLGGKDGPQYLVTWSNPLPYINWSDFDEYGEGPRPPITTLLPQESFYFQRFSADGTPVGSEEFGQGIVTDLDHDGEPDVIQRIMEADERGGRKMAVEYLTVRSPDYSSPRKLTILYNTHAPQDAPANAWGYQVKLAKDGTAEELQLGPILVPEGVKPEASFRWDAAKKIWAGPKSKPGDHFRVLKKEEEADEIAKRGGLGYPLMPSASPAVNEVAKEEVDDADDIPRDKLSKPYRAQSLASLSPEALFEFMTKRQNAWDYVHRPTPQEAGFWTLEPQAAAMHFAQHRRPPAENSGWLIAPDTRTAAPEEGSLSYVDGPSGCFSPSGAYVYHLHCAREGSSLVYAESIAHWWQVPVNENGRRYDFLKIDLTYEEARHLFQTIWWLSRIRSTKIFTNSANPLGGSTSDGFARLIIRSEAHSEIIEDTRSGVRERFPGGSGEYSPASLINLVFTLFLNDLPKRLGERWEAQASAAKREYEDARMVHTPEELSRIKTRSAEMLQLFCDEGGSKEVVSQVVQAVGEEGWKDLRPLVDAAAAKLPPLTTREEQVAAIEAEVKTWKEKLGFEGSDRARLSRDIRRDNAEKIAAKETREPAIPGLPSPEAPNLLDEIDKNLPVLSNEERAKFDAFDLLAERAERARQNLPTEDRALASLREAIRITRRQLDIFDDPEALLNWGQTERFQSTFALRRLSTLDRNRARELLTHFSTGENDETSTEMLEDALETLSELDGQPVSAAHLSEQERKTALALLRDPKADYKNWCRALETLVPKDEPRRYEDPAIDETLLILLKPPYAGAIGGFLLPFPSLLPRPVAQRLGANAWDPLMDFSVDQSWSGLGAWQSSLPLLTALAQAGEETQRRELQERLAKQLEVTHGYLNDTFRAIWVLNRTDLKPQLEKIATSGPEDFEGVRATGSGSHRLQTNQQRYHLARQVLALWDEPNAVTKAQMSVALAANQLSEKDWNGVVEKRLREDLQTLNLSISDRKTVFDFVEWCEQHRQTARNQESFKAIRKIASEALIGK